MNRLKHLLDDRRRVQERLEPLTGRDLLADEQRSYDRLASELGDLGADIEQAVADLPSEGRSLQIVKANFDARRGKVNELRSIDTSAMGRPYNAAENAKVNRLRAEVDEIDGRVAAILDQEVRSTGIDGATNRLLGGRHQGDVETRDSSVLPTLEYRMTDWAQTHGHIRPEERNMSFRKWVRGAVTGDWTDADLERRAMSEGVLAGGGYAVPTPLSTRIIDRARNAARVLQAGAVTVPMDSATMKIARVAGDQTAAWHTENAAIAASDMTLEAVTLTARTLTSLVVASRELIEDAQGVEVALEQAFAAQLALSLDLAALYGSGTAPEPRGVKNTTGVITQSQGTNGATVTNYDPIVDAIGTLWDNNEAPNGIIYAPRTARTMAKLKDTTNQPLVPPDVVKELPRFQTNQVPINLTQGSATTATDAFVADWTQLLVGVRHGFTIEVLKERYADNYQLGFLAHLRADVVVARPKAFVVVTGII